MGKKIPKISIIDPFLKDTIFEILSTLPEDAILEILSRLPVKSLARFKSVSKSWLGLICDQHFIHKHLTINNNSNSQHESLLISHLRPLKRQVLSSLSCEGLEIERKCFRLSYANPDGEFRGYAQIIGPCNGLFCLFDGKESLSVWNPSTRQLKFLPKSLVEPPPNAFPSDVCVGFGFDAKKNDYKIFAYKHMYLPSSITIAHAELYTLRTNEWRGINVGQEFQPDSNLPLSPCNPSIDGVFSWFEMDSLVEKVIMSFDMKEEVFKKTRLPEYEGVPSQRVNGCLATLGNSLAFIHDYPLGGVSKSFDVWVLGEYGVQESWTKHISIGPLLEVKSPLGFWRNGELLFEASRGKLVSYDPTTKDMEEIGGRGVEYILQVVPYKESLVCPQGGHGEFEQDKLNESPFYVCECRDDSV